MFNKNKIQQKYLHTYVHCIYIYDTAKPCRFNDFKKNGKICKIFSMQDTIFFRCMQIICTFTVEKI